ncbi:MAG: glycosyltransferase 87 family protein [Bdellovibrionota bacterium]|jgi:hypothetical protein
MKISNNTIFLIFSSLALAILCALFIPEVERRSGDDFMQYWSAGRLLRSGQNPYDPNEQLSLQKETWHGEEIPLPIMMYNPPPALSFALVASIPNYRISYRIWIALSILLIISSCFLAQKVVSKNPIRSRYTRYVILITLTLFQPFLISLYPGQCSPLLLIGFLTSLYYIKKDQLFIAGLFLSLTFFKPHILYLFYLALILNLKKDSLKLLGGAFVGSLLLSIPALIYQPHIFSLYLEAMQTPPLNFHTPTLGAWLQYFLNIHNNNLRFLPSLLCIIITVLSFFIFNRRFSKLTLLSIILPLSILSSPYGWTYDQMLLLPTLFVFFNLSQDLYQKGSILISQILLFLPLITTAIIISHVYKLDQQYTVFYPLVLLLVGLSCRAIFPKYYKNN